jgi:hypothetical protein
VTKGDRRRRLFRAQFLPRAWRCQKEVQFDAAGPFTVGDETEIAAGEKSNAVETHSYNNSGFAPDSSLHRTCSVTPVRKTDPGGKTTDPQGKQPNPDDPNGNLQVTTKPNMLCDTMPPVRSRQKSFKRVTSMAPSA